MNFAKSNSLRKFRSRLKMTQLSRSFAASLQSLKSGMSHLKFRGLLIQPLSRKQTLAESLSAISASKNRFFLSGQAGPPTHATARIIHWAQGYDHASKTKLMTIVKVVAAAVAIAEARANHAYKWTIRPPSVTSVTRWIKWTKSVLPTTWKGRGLFETSKKFRETVDLSWMLSMKSTSRQAMPTRLPRCRNRIYRRWRLKLLNVTIRQ